MLLPNARATRDMAHSELKAYSSDEEIEESDEEQIMCVCAPLLAPDAAIEPTEDLPAVVSRRCARTLSLPCQLASSVTAHFTCLTRSSSLSNAARSRNTRNCHPGCAGWTPWSSTG